MTHISFAADKFRDLTRGDAHRSYLISRAQPPIVYHSGDMHLKRLRVLMRFAANRFRSCAAAVRVALVADKIRRARHELAFHPVRHDHVRATRTSGGARR